MGLFDFLKGKQRKEETKASNKPVSETEFAKGITLESFEETIGDEEPIETVEYDIDGKQVTDT